MNNPYVHDFLEDDGVEERPSYGCHIEPTYELPTYGYMAKENSSPVEHDCRPTNGHPDTAPNASLSQSSLV